MSLPGDGVPGGDEVPNAHPGQRDCLGRRMLSGVGLNFILLAPEANSHNPRVATPPGGEVQLPSRVHILVARCEVITRDGP